MSNFGISNSDFSFDRSSVRRICSGGVLAAAKELEQRQPFFSRDSNIPAIYLAGALTNIPEEDARWRLSIKGSFSNSYYFLDPLNHAKALDRLVQNGDISRSEYADATDLCDKGNIVLSDGVLAGIQRPSFGTGHGLHFAYRVHRPVVALTDRPPNTHSPLAYSVVGSDDKFFQETKVGDALDFLSREARADPTIVLLNSPSSNTWNIDRNWILAFIRDHIGNPPELTDRLVIALRHSIHHALLKRCHYIDSTSDLMPLRLEYSTAIDLIWDKMLSYFYLMGSDDVASDLLRVILNIRFQPRIHNIQYNPTFAGASAELLAKSFYQVQLPLAKLLQHVNTTILNDAHLNRTNDRPCYIQHLKEYITSKGEYARLLSSLSNKSHDLIDLFHLFDYSRMMHSLSSKQLQPIYNGRPLGQSTIMPYTNPASCAQLLSLIINILKRKEKHISVTALTGSPFISQSDNEVTIVFPFNPALAYYTPNETEAIIANLNIEAKSLLHGEISILHSASSSKIFFIIPFDIDFQRNATIESIACTLIHGFERNIASLLTGVLKSKKSGNWLKEYAPNIFCEMYEKNGPKMWLTVRDYEPNVPLKHCTLSNLKAIVERNWVSLMQYFAMDYDFYPKWLLPSMESSSKKELDWFKKLILIRNRISHPVGTVGKPISARDVSHIRACYLHISKVCQGLSPSSRS